jgi:surface antigen
MLELSVFRRPLAALAFCSVAVALYASPAAARSHHGDRSHGTRGNFREPRYPAQPYFPEGTAYPQVMPYSQAASYPRFASRQRVRHPRIAQVHRRRMERHAALSRLRHYANAQASVTPYEPGGGMVMTGNSSSLVMEARHYLGTNRTGHRGTGSDMADSFVHYGHRISGPQVGAIAVMGRRGGGHVGIITGINAAGKVIMISGNNGNRVREAPVSRGRIYAYVMPN